MASRIRENLNVNVQSTYSRLNLDDRIRCVLIYNDAVALSLGFASGASTGKAVFHVLGAFLSFSFLMNIPIVLVATRARRTQGALMLRDGNRAPSLSILALDVSIVVALLILYIITTVEAASSYSWEPVVMMVYVSIGALVAMIIHGWLAASALVRYVRYRRSLDKERCPHCHTPFTFRVEDPRSAFPQVDSPSSAEDEGDTLLAKDQK
ncbi:hypothetical protein LTS17_000403 [Exophiala oligosperma]